MSTTHQALTGFKYCLYARKSSEAEDRQALSIESQITELGNMCLARSIRVIKTYHESYSAYHPGRPIFNQMVGDIESGKCDAIVAWGT